MNQTHTKYFNTHSWVEATGSLCTTTPSGFFIWYLTFYSLLFVWWIKEWAEGNFLCCVFLDGNIPHQYEYLTPLNQYQIGLPVLSGISCEITFSHFHISTVTLAVVMPSSGHQKTQQPLNSSNKVKLPLRSPCFHTHRQGSCNDTAHCKCI